MSKPPSALSSSWTGRFPRSLIALTFALSLAATSCGSSEPKTEVLGEVEGEGNGEFTGVHLIEPLCITNTPTHEPC